MLKFGLIEPGLQFSAKHLQQHWGAVILARHLNIAKLILFIFINTEHTNRKLSFNIIKVTNTVTKKQIIFT